MSELVNESGLSKGAFYHNYLAGVKQRLYHHPVIAEGTIQVNFQNQTDEVLLEVSSALTTFYQQLTP
jgi:hypothetical protein